MRKKRVEVSNFSLGKPVCLLASESLMGGQ